MSRDINRSQVAREDVDIRLASGKSGELFERLSTLIRVRRAQSAFSPDAHQAIHNLDARVVAVERRSESQTILALHNVSSDRVELNLPAALSDVDLLGGATTASSSISLEPWQVAWLVL